MEKNHICKKCGGIAGWDSYFQSWICTRCGNEEPKPITRADRIRAMSDEELAGELLDLFIAFYAVEWSEETILDWLRQEANE